MLVEIWATTAYLENVDYSYRIVYNKNIGKHNIVINCKYQMKGKHALQIKSLIVSTVESTFNTFSEC